MKSIKVRIVENSYLINDFSGFEFPTPEDQIAFFDVTLVLRVSGL